MRRAPVVIVLALVAGCSSTSTRVHADKETYVEAPPHRPLDDEAIEPHPTFKYPLDVIEVDRGYCIARPINPSADGLITSQAILINSAQEEPIGAAQPSAPASKDEPPPLIWFPDRSDVRETSACYLGHVAFFEPESLIAQGRPMHHVRFHVVNREPLTLEVVLSSFLLSTDLSDPRSEPLTFVAAANDRGFAIDKLVLPPGSDETAHLFFREAVSLTPVVSAGWTVRLVAPDGSVEQRTYGARLVRRYVAREAPISPLEDAVSRDPSLLELETASAPWVDPSLEAIGGSGDSDDGDDIGDSGGR
jgi:hypothetical protein